MSYRGVEGSGSAAGAGAGAGQLGTDQGRWLRFEVSVDAHDGFSRVDASKFPLGVEALPEAKTLSVRQVEAGRGESLTIEMFEMILGYTGWSLRGEFDHWEVLGFKSKGVGAYQFGSDFMGGTVVQTERSSDVVVKGISIGERMVISLGVVRGKVDLSRASSVGGVKIEAIEKGGEVILPPHLKVLLFGSGDIKGTLNFEGTHAPGFKKEGLANIMMQVVPMAQEGGGKIVADQFVWEFYVDAAMKSGVNLAQYDLPGEAWAHYVFRCLNGELKRDLVMTRRVWESLKDTPWGLAIESRIFHAIKEACQRPTGFGVRRESRPWPVLIYDCGHIDDEEKVQVPWWARQVRFTGIAGGSLDMSRVVNGQTEGLAAQCDREKISYTGPQWGMYRTLWMSILKGEFEGLDVKASDFDQVEGPQRDLMEEVLGREGRFRDITYCTGEIPSGVKHEVPGWAKTVRLNVAGGEVDLSNTSYRMQRLEFEGLKGCELDLSGLACLSLVVIKKGFGKGGVLRVPSNKYVQFEEGITDHEGELDLREVDWLNFPLEKEGLRSLFSASGGGKILLSDAVKDNLRRYGVLGESTENSKLAWGAGAQA